MISFFKSLLAPKAQTVNDPITIALLSVLGKQLRLLGYEYEQVPPLEPYISKDCRGYLMGIAHGIIQCEGRRVTKRDIEDAVLISFILVFGKNSGPNLALKTIVEFEPGSGLAQGYVFGTHEVEAIYGSGASFFATGFHLFATQEK